MKTQTESDAALNARFNGLVGRAVECPAGDDRVFIIPPDEPLYAGDPAPLVLDVEARTRVRLKTGENPCRFLRLNRHFMTRRDPDGGVSFREYMARRHPEMVEADTPHAAPTKPTGKGHRGRPGVDDAMFTIYVDLSNRWRAARVGGQKKQNFINSAPQGDKLQAAMAYLRSPAGEARLAAQKTPRRKPVKPA